MRGERETGLLTSALRMEARLTSRDLETREMTLERQCVYEFIDQLTGLVDQYEAVLSLACGAGVQAVAPGVVAAFAALAADAPVAIQVQAAGPELPSIHENAFLMHCAVVSVLRRLRTVRPGRKCAGGSGVA